MPLPLLALFFAAFAFGTTEFVIAGVLPQVAAGLAVSVPSAGYLVSGYAVGAPGGRLPRSTKLASEASMFRAQLLREDLARLRRLCELAAAAADRESYAAAARRLGWTQGDTRTPELVHVLGVAPDGTGTVMYVVEPHGRSVFADHKQPGGPDDPLAWTVDRQLREQSRPVVMPTDGTNPGN